MSTAGQALGGVVGAIAGFLIGGPTGALYGAQIGMTLGGIIDPVKGPNLQGPRLEDMTVQTATYGAPIPRVYGTVALSGNVFWLENNALKEVATTNPTETQGGKGGGSGPTTTTYAYYATFAVGLCQGPIAGVRRIWIRNQLIYDAGSGDIGTCIASNAAATAFTLHLGDDAQQPDDRMQATLGVANTPAYRGLAYLVFHDFALADYSNSLMGAQVKVEVIATGSSVPSATLRSAPASGKPWIAVAYQKIALTVSMLGDVAYSNDGDTWYSLNAVPAIPYVTWQILGTCGEKFVLAGYNAATNYAIILTSFDGRVWAQKGSDYVGGANLRGFSALSNSICICAGLYMMVSTDGGETWQAVAMPGSTTWGGVANNGRRFVAISSGGTGARIATSGTGLVWADAGPSYFSPGILAGSPTGFVMFYANTGTTAYFSADGDTWTAVILPTSLNTMSVAWSGAYFIAVSPSIKALVSADGQSWTYFSLPDQANNISSIGGNGILFTVGTSDYFLKIIPMSSSASAVGLAAVVSCECLQSGLLSANDLDVTALTTTVRGYRVTNIGTIRSALDILRGAFPFDVVQSGYQIVFKPRGGSSVATIPAADLDARNAGDSPGVSVTNSREMDSVLPARVVLKYLDADLEYGNSSQYAERLNTLAINVTSIDLPMVLTATEAAGIAETLLYLYWLERNDLKFTLPATWQALEPGDVITLAATESTYSLRLTSITYTQDSRLECQAKYAASALYSPAAQGEAGRSLAKTISPIGASALALLDIPLLLDATDTPGFPVAVCGYAGSWTGGTLYRTDDAGQTWTVVQGFTAPGAVIGFATTILPDGRTNLIDPTGLLNVALLQGSLSSVTESALFSGSNHFAYGADGHWEILGAKTCTQQADGSYNLSDLLRGRQGTEWACNQHAASDRVILLDASTLAFVGAALNSIGLARTYRAITNGRTMDTGDDVPFTYHAVNLECLSPVYPNGNRHPTTNDWTLTWIRRTRVGGAWRDYVDASLGETSEAYEIDIFSSNTYATLKRTLTGLTSATAAYTSAQQITDFGSNQPTIYFRIYQISANAGRGYPLTTSLTR